MHVTVDAAAAQLPELVRKAQRGESVVIVWDDHAGQVAAPKAERPRPRFGSAVGQIHLAPDFDAIPDDFAEYTK